MKIAEAVREERKRLLPLREIADKVIDTTGMTLGELKEAISQTLELTRTREMTLSVVSFGYKHGVPLDYDVWRHLRPILDWLSENWRQLDEGIWEVRGGRRPFVSSRVLSWVALDRAIRMARQRGLPAPEDRWIKQRDAIYEEIMEKGWNPERESFVQYYGGEALDASLLLMPLVKFVGPTDPRWLATLDRIQEELAYDTLVYRYKVDEAADDGFSSEEGSFSICSFWLVECLARAGRLEEARLSLEKMFSYANHLGLFAEEIGPSGEALGNFPQAFTHLSLISAAVNLDQALG